MRLEEQIRQLASLGIPLNDGITLDDLLISFDRAQYEKKPFRQLLTTMGGEAEQKPWGRLISDRVWFFDTECIEDGGDYVAIVERLAMMARADDRLDDVRDKIDFVDEEAWIRYRIDGEPRHIDAELEDAWADVAALREVARDLESSGYRFACAEDGQTLIIVYLDKKSLRALREMTGMRFDWLSDS